MRVDLPSGTPAELAIPEGEVTGALVIAPDVMGLRALFDDLVARLAAEQRWAVVSVEPFPGPDADLALADRLEHRIDAERLTTDLQLGADLVQERTGVAGVGILGFCMGGMNAFRAAGTGRFDRAVAFYGMIRPPAPWSVAPGGDDPLDALARPECCPVLAVLGGVDPYTPPSDVADLDAVGDHVTIHVYDAADHGFVHDPSRPNHRADDAADAWRRAIAFLRS
jgi:carboxymethylenebutenolidase